MTVLSRLLCALAPLSLIASLPLAAQDVAEQPSVSADALSAPKYLEPDDPWIYRGTDIPVDPEWQFGEMPNGLRYAVRNNGVPPGQVSIRVRIGAGSLYEGKGEAGFAHLLEHLTYRESKYLGFGEAIPKFQRWGAAFGSDTNAETTPTHTVYKLTLPNAQPDTLREAVRLISGMIREPTLSKADLAADVPIVLAERRDRIGPELRIADASRETFFKGLLLADHSVIGTVEDLQGATPKAVRAFHDRWYRPDNTTIAAVGDVDPRVLADLVEQYFGDWQNEGAKTPRPDFGTPQAPAGSDPDNPVGQTTVMVEPGQPRSMTYAYLRPYVQVTDNMELNRRRLIDAVGEAIINRRLEARARNGGKFLYAGVDHQDISHSASATFVSFAPLDADWQGALSDVRSVIADALETPPSQEEIDREVAGLEVAFTNQVEQSTIQAGSQLADDIMQAVDIGESVGTPDLFLTVFRQSQDRFTPQAVFEHTRQLFEANVIRAFYLTPTAGEATDEQLGAALREMPDTDGSVRQDGPAISFADLPPIGVAQAPVATRPIGVYEIQQIDYANGVKALVWNSGNEPGRVTVRVRFGSGWRGFTGDTAVYAHLGEMALVGAGEGMLGQDEIERVTVGRKIGFDFRIDDGTFVFEGLTRQADLADQLYLFAEKLAHPRWDKQPIERALASSKLAYDSYDLNPGAVLNRDLEYLLSNKDARFATPTPKQLDSATAEGMREVWEPLLKQGPVEVDVFGDIDEQAAIDAISKTFGALPARLPIDRETLARSIDFPPGGGAPVVLRHGGDEEQAAAVIAWPSGGGSAGLQESRKVDLLSRIFSNRIVDALREKAGSSYSPQVFSDWPTDIAGGGRIVVLAQMPPGQVDPFFATTESIAADLAQNGPSEEDLRRAAEPMAQLITRIQTGHTFWLNQLEGSTNDPNLVANLRSLLRDYTQTPKEELQMLAQKYLQMDKAFKVAVLPRDRAR
ncbi:insulinase family protein [Altererythrobacter salegens]|uniref:Insulinase family protein n=1 Tax=Croceibacterium salegens TaxID=1737568 RepID=A0A6I4SWA3_9SPHN|nr:M16 family metallopeptidase [Croceibacterium salegens]MXO59350.1 insulinase family protein [Croceibacterium salegens]